MCDSPDWESEVLAVRRIKARKAHRCMECSVVIDKGAEYVRTAVLCDSRASAYKHCLRCDRIEQAHFKAEHSMGASGGFLIGDLRSTIGECIREESHYVVAFRAAWKGEPVPQRPRLASRRQYSTNFASTR